MVTMANALKERIVFEWLTPELERATRFWEKFSGWEHEAFPRTVAALPEDSVRYRIWWQKQELEVLAAVLVDREGARYIAGASVLTIEPWRVTEPDGLKVYDNVDVFVRPKWQGGGIGGELVKQSIARAHCNANLYTAQTIEINQAMRLLYDKQVARHLLKSHRSKERVDYFGNGVLYPYIVYRSSFWPTTSRSK